MKIKITKKGYPDPIVLKNGDKYDGLFEILNDNEEKIFECACNTDPTKNYDGGEIAAGEYIYRKRYRKDGKIVFDILTKNGSNILPSVKQNRNHGNKKIIQAVQIHCGSTTWDGSHGCITIPPVSWQNVKNLLSDYGMVKIIEINEQKKET